MAGTPRLRTRRALVLLLISILTFSQVPAPAWAAALGTVEVMGQSPDTSAFAAGTAGEAIPEATLEGRADEAEASDGPASSEGDAPAVEEGPAPAPQASAPASDVAAIPAASAAVPLSASAEDAGRPAAPSSVAAESAPAARAAVTDGCKLIIQGSQDAKDDKKLARDVAVGTVLWANLHEKGGILGAGPSIPREDSWSYQWYAASSARADPADYALIEGAVEQSLTLTDELVGSYLIVKAKVGSLEFYAPAGSAAGTINTGFLPGPVVETSGVELNKVELDSTEPALGDVLTATAYVSRTKPVDEGVDVTWTWYQSVGTGDSEDAYYGDYELIPGEGDRQLTVTDAMTGRYLKVVASAGVNEVETVTGMPVSGAPSAIRLDFIELDAPDSLTLGSKLAGRASYLDMETFENVYPEEGVTYIWKYTKSDPDAVKDAVWTVIEGAHDATFTVDDERYVGTWITCEASAGVNTVDGAKNYAWAGPVEESEITAITPTVSVAGWTAADAKGDFEYWAYRIPVSTFSGAEVKDVIVQALDAAGLAYAIAPSGSDYKVGSITAPDGSFTLGTGKDWYVYRDGKRVSFTGAMGNARTVETSEDIELYCYSLTDLAPSTPAPVERTRVHATVTVIGPDTSGADALWLDEAYCEVPFAGEGAPSAWDASAQAFDAGKLVYDASDSSYGISLNTITSPMTGEALGWDEGTGRYWQLFIDGVSASMGAGGVELSDGMHVTWYYSAWGAELPSNESLRMQEVSFAVLVADEGGAFDEAWVPAATRKVAASATLRSLIEDGLDGAGIAAEISDDGDGGGYFWIDALAYRGERLAGDGYSGPCWHVFLNGEDVTNAGAGLRRLSRGDEVALCYTAGKTLPGVVSMTARVIGKNAEDEPELWAEGVSLVVPEGAMGDVVVPRALDAAGLAWTLDDAGDGYVRVGSITSPNGGGLTLTAGAYNDSLLITGDAWYPYVNGKFHDAWLNNLGELTEIPGATVPHGHEFSDGDVLTLYYGRFNEPLPDVDDSDGPGEDELPVDPDAPRPDWDDEATWGQFANGGQAVSLPTPTEGVEVAEKFDIGASASDPLVVNGYVYLATGDGRLLMLDTSDLSVCAEASTGAAFFYFCRLVYADGLVILAADDGRVAAFTADTLTCVWRTDPLPASEAGDYQSLSTLTVNGCALYAAFTVPGAAMEPSLAGILVCIDIEDGSIRWTHEAVAEGDRGAGYYWAGAAVSGDDVVIGTDAGTLELIDGATGKTLSAVEVGAMVRSGVTAVGDDAFIAASYDGALHKVRRVGDDLVGAGSVSFASKSTSTPVVSGSHAFVGGVSYSEARARSNDAVPTSVGTLSVIDLDAMALVKTVTAGAGEVQCAPLVSVQDDGTYVYFTCNAKPGCVWSYRVGDESAYQLNALPEGYEQYSTGSVVADEEGNLYYTNDSKTLFKLGRRDAHQVTFDVQGGSHVPSAWVAAGAPVTRPADPRRTGYRFRGWFLDAEGATAWDFDTPVTAALTLYACWEQDDGKVPVTPVPPATDGGGVADGTVTGPSKRPLGNVLAGPGKRPLGQAAARSKDKVEARTTASEGGVAVLERADGEVGTASAGQGDAPLNALPLVGVGTGIAGLVLAGLWLYRPNGKGL